MKLSRREKGAITRVATCIDNQGFGFTFWVYIELSSGTQGFGGVEASDPELINAFKKELCDLFDVSGVDSLKEKECYILRCWEDMGAEVEGIESPKTGKRITITDFLCRHTGDSRSALERRLENLTKKIREIDDIRKEFEKQADEVSKGFFAWENLFNGKDKSSQRE